MFFLGGGLVFLINLVLLVLAGWAFIDALTRPTPAFAAAGKLTKPKWLAILGVALLLCLTGRAGVFGLLGAVVAVAVIVYLVDVRPAVRGMRPGGPWG